jgi:putative hydrolases of HD superfamily
VTHPAEANPPGFDYHFNLDYGRRYTAHHPFIVAIREIMDEETRARGAPD